MRIIHIRPLIRDTQTNVNYKNVNYCVVIFGPVIDGQTESNPKSPLCMGTCSKRDRDWSAQYHVGRGGIKSQSFLSLPVHVARWALMHRFLSVRLSTFHWTLIHIS